jgi:hypothetical protein
VLGGSWSGPLASNKDAELFDPSADTWTKLPGVKASSILTKDPEGTYRADNYGWFFPWSGSSGAPRSTCMRRSMHAATRPLPPRRSRELPEATAVHACSVPRGAEHHHALVQHRQQG